MARYLRKLRRVGSLGPSEEPGAGLWAGYDLAGTDADLSSLGFLRADDLSPEQLARYGVTMFTHIAEDDHTTREKLGLGRIE